jgi:hypothetical protein
MFTDSSEAGLLRRVRALTNTRDARLRRSGWYALASSAAARDYDSVECALVACADLCGIDPAGCRAYLAQCM